VSIRIPNGKKIFKCCLHFSILIKVLSAALQPAVLCVQFADSAGNIAAGALIQTVFREILRGRGLFHVTATCKHLCYIV
jgi:hypothetical protein